MNIQIQNENEELKQQIAQLRIQKGLPAENYEEEATIDQDEVDKLEEAKMKLDNKIKD